MSKNGIYFLVALFLLKAGYSYSEGLKDEVKGVGFMTKEEEKEYYCSNHMEDLKTEMGKEDFRKALYETLPSIKGFIPEEYKGENKREARIEFMKMRNKRQDTKMLILCTNRISEKDKLDLVMEDIYNACKMAPDIPYINIYYFGLMRLYIDEGKILKRVLEESSSKRAEDECFEKSITLMLAYLSYGSRDIGDKLIDIFDRDRSNTFRLWALEAFIQGYSDYYTKEELMPYIKKLMKEPYFTICKACDVVTGTECIGKMKSYPFRSALKRLLIKYKIKFEYIQLDRCMIGGVPVLVDE